jgi:hypothetical protein
VEAAIDMLRDIPSLVTNEENAELAKEILEEEIISTIWGLEPNKAQLRQFSIIFLRHASS